METVYTDRSDPTVDAIVRAAFPDYRGRKVRLLTAERVTLSGTYWSGGSRSSYAIVRIDGVGRATARPLPHFDPPEYGGPAQDPAIDLPELGAVVERSYFQGRDMGVRITVRPGTLAPLLSDAPELTPLARLALELTRCLNSRGRKEERKRIGLSDADWQRGQRELIDAGLLTRGGAITNAGRNAASGKLGAAGIIDALRAYREGR